VQNFTIVPLDKNYLFTPTNFKEDNPLSDLSDIVDELMGIEKDRRDIKDEDVIKITDSFNLDNKEKDVNQDIEEIVSNYEIMCKESRLEDDTEERILLDNHKFQHINIDGSRRKSEFGVDVGPIGKGGGGGGDRSENLHSNNETKKTLQFDNLIGERKISEESNDNDDSFIINEIIKNSQIKHQQGNSKDTTNNQIIKRVLISDDVTYIGYNDKFNIKNLLILDANGKLLREKTKNRIRHKPIKDKEFKPDSIMKETYVRKNTCEKREDRGLDSSIRSTRSNPRTIGKI
jgi:hypothetical protein